ncbi:MAG: response regulator transcription factor [Armatimonas sp.]
MERLLLIDDDRELCQLLIELLSADGFTVEAAHHGQLGLDRALTGEFALVILDVMLPGISGMEVLRRLRATSQLPVLMLTARGDDAIDRVLGLESGADDYLPKPFHPRELLARLRAILRRVGPRPGEGRVVLDIAGLHIDTGARVALQRGQPLTLTATEYELLALLLRSAGQVVSREALAQAALGRPLSGLDRSLDVHISHLRQKLGESGDRIKTVRGVGFQFALPETQAVS